jgi:hypothetical protein
LAGKCSLTTPDTRHPGLSNKFLAGKCSLTTLDRQTIDPGSFFDTGDPGQTDN